MRVPAIKRGEMQIAVGIDSHCFERIDLFCHLHRAKLCAHRSSDPSCHHECRETGPSSVIIALATINPVTEASPLSDN